MLSYIYSEYKKRNIQRQINLVFDPYKNSLESIIDSNINNEISDKNNLL